MANQPPKPNLNKHRNFVYPPARAVTVSLEVYEERQHNKRLLNFGVSSIDARVVPPIPGDLVVFIGRPGHGKTLSLVYLAKQASKSLTLQQADPKEIVLYVTWETRVEEFVGLVSAGISGFSLSDIGRGKADLVQVKNAAVQLLNERIYVVGRSKYNINDGDFNLLDLEKIIQELVEDGYIIAGCYIDYLQEIPPLKTQRDQSLSGKVMYVSENLRFCKRLGMVYGIRMFAAVQATREVDDQEGLAFPSLNDGQFTSAVEQVSDKVFSQTIPSKYLRVGSTVENVNGNNYKIAEYTLCLRLLKQRWGVANMNDLWVLHFNPVLLELAEQTATGTYVEESNDPGF